MTISLVLNQSQIQIQILSGPFWSQDLARIKTLSEKKWDSGSKKWLVPLSCLSEIKDKWQSYELIYETKETEFKAKSDPISLDLLPKILEKLDFNTLCTKYPKQFQERYIRLNRTAKRTILACPTGSGKSLTSILRYKILEHKTLLIVCPKILKTNWQVTLKADFNLDSIVYWGTAKQKEKINITDSNIVITTYETIADLKRFDFESIIVDEAHLLANPKSNRYKSFKKYFDFMNKLDGVQLLSGTPIQHKPKDLWSLVNLIDPVLSGTYVAWCDQYEEVIKSFRKEIVLKDRIGNVIRDSKGNPKTFTKDIPLITKTKNLHKLKEKLSTIMYRISREDALECQEEQELVYVDLTKAQERLYHSIKNEILVELENKTLTMAHAPVRMLRLLQACEGLYNFNINNLESSKLEYICHEIDHNLEDDKLVVWSRFKPLTFILKELYADKVAIYNGDVSDPLKQLSIWAFNGVSNKEELETYKRLQDQYNYPFDPGKAQVWVGVIDGRSSLGFDLHRQCNRQILASYSFLSSANYQATSRLVRLGQLKDFVSTQYLVARNTLEPDALNLIFKNFSNALNIIDGKDSIHYGQMNKLISLLKG